MRGRRAVARAVVPRALSSERDAARLRKYFHEYQRSKSFDEGARAASIQEPHAAAESSPMVEAWLSMVECDELKEQVQREASQKPTNEGSS